MIKLKCKGLNEKKIYIYIEREREREREGGTKSVFMALFIYENKYYSCFLGLRIEEDPCLD